MEGLNSVLENTPGTLLQRGWLEVQTVQTSFGACLFFVFCGEGVLQPPFCQTRVLLFPMATGVLGIPARLWAWRRRWPHAPVACRESWGIFPDLLYVHAGYPPNPFGWLSVNQDDGLGKFTFGVIGCFGPRPLSDPDGLSYKVSELVCSDLQFVFDGFLWLLSLFE